MNYKLISLILISFIIACGVVQTSNAATFVDSGAHPDEIFKCQPSIIYANFTDYSGITTIKLLINNSRPFRMEHGKFVYSNEALTMTYAAGQAYYVYANDPTTIDGYKSIAFAVTDTGVTTIYSTSTTLNVYSDTCTGTNIQGYYNVSNGLDMPYTGQPFTSDISFFDWIIKPYTDTMGSIFFFLIIMTLMIVVYMKSKNIISTITVGILLWTLTLGSGYIPQEYYYIVAIMLALGITALLSIIFIKRKE